MVQFEIPRVTFVVGGARSGKSAWAEKFARASALKPVYLATAKADAQSDDGEMASRIAQHRKRRGDTWTTLEVPLALSEVLLKESRRDRVILVDCLTLWLSNMMEESPAGEEGGIESCFGELTGTLGRLEGPVILVSNEVGLGIVPMTPMGREFRDLSGRMNQAVAGSADLALFMVAGLPLTLKAPSGWEAPQL